VIEGTWCLGELLELVHWGGSCRRVSPKSPPPLISASVILFEGFRPFKETSGCWWRCSNRQSLPVVMSVSQERALCGITRGPRAPAAPD
jgi:hypothetical protein